MEEEDGQTEAKGQHHPNGAISLMRLLSHNAEDEGGDNRSHNGTHSDGRTDKECRRRAGQGQFGGTVDGERHLPHHNERADKARDEAQQYRRDKGMLHEIIGKQATRHRPVDKAGKEGARLIHGAPPRYLPPQAGPLRAPR